MANLSIISFYLWTLVRTGEVFEADPTHDYVNIDEEDPYPYAPIPQDILRTVNHHTHEFKGKPRVWYLGHDPESCSGNRTALETQAASETEAALETEGFWLVSEQAGGGSDEGSVDRVSWTYSPRICLLNRCGLDSSLLPTCNPKQRSNDEGFNDEGFNDEKMSVVALPERAHPSLSKVFTTSLSLLSWDSLVHYLHWEFNKGSWGGEVSENPPETNQVWGLIEHRWQESFELLVKMISISYATMMQLRADSVAHCLYSWHAVTLDARSKTDAGTPRPDFVTTDAATTEAAAPSAVTPTSASANPGPAEPEPAKPESVKLGSVTLGSGSVRRGEDSDKEVVGLRHTGFASPLGRCPHLLRSGSSINHLADIQRHFDRDDRVALLKQTRVHTQALMAVVRLLLQDFRKSQVARAVHAIHNLTEAALMSIANLQHTNETERERLLDEELERWYQFVMQVRHHDSATVDAMAPEPWQPVYSGRVPAFILHLRKWHRDRLDTLMAACGLEPFEKPTNGYHSLVGFGLVRRHQQKSTNHHNQAAVQLTDHEIVDVCTGQVLPPGQKVTFKTPMSTTLTHLHDWTRDWREDRDQLLHNCGVLQDPHVGHLLTRIYVVRRRMPGLERDGEERGGEERGGEERGGEERGGEERGGEEGGGEEGGGEEGGGRENRGGGKETQFIYDNYTTIEEFVDGRNLRELLLSDGVSASEQQALVASTTRQLLRFWRAGYSHGDLSLGNILIKNTPRGQIKVIDAGSLKKDNPLFRDDRYFQHLRELFPAKKDSFLRLVPDLSKGVPTQQAIQAIERFIQQLTQHTP